MHTRHGLIRSPRPGEFRLRVLRLLCLALLALCVSPVQAQFLPFGRNKVAYTDFDWRVLSTEHFDIYYYPEMEDLARRGATFAEGSFVELESRFNYTVMHRIPLIFYSSHLHFQQTNISPGFIPEGVGGFFEFIKGRVVIPYTGSLWQFRHVIQHELVHVFMHNKVSQVLRDHGVPAERYPPLWFVEGLAEYFSTRWDSQAEMLLRDAVHYGYVAPLRSINMIAGSFLMYKEGQNALMFIAEEYSEESIVRIIENLWKSADFRDVLHWSTGATMDDIDRAWLRWLRKRLYPLAGGRDRASDVSEALVAEGFAAKPFWYRKGDSSYVVYMGNNSGYTGVYRVSTTGGEPELLLEGERSGLFETFHAYQTRISVTPDGRVACVTKSGERDVLHVIDIDTRTRIRSMQIGTLVTLGSPSWAPDGRRIVLSGADASGESNLYIVDVERDELRALTRDPYDDRDPSWSPDGSSIAFVSDRGPGGERGAFQLFLTDTTGRTIEYLAQDSGSFAAPSWSPDGKWILCTNDREGVHDVYALRPHPASTSQRTLHRLTSLLSSAFDPIWTGDGDLVFAAFDAYRFSVRRLRGITERLDSAASVAVDIADPADKPWNVPQWRGDAASASIRYEKEYQLDIAQSQISTDPIFGTVGGAALSVSDLFGNDNYYFLIYNTAQTSSELLSSFNIAVSRMSLGARSPYAYGIYSFSGRRYDLLDPDEYFIERAYGAYGALAYPLTAFQRIEGSVSLGSSDKEALYELRQRKALLLTNSVSYVSDNALYYITGPIDGSRFNATLSFTTDVQYSNVNFFSVMVDYRRYLRLGTRSALAARLELLYNDGREARRYFLGGSWDLRGWPRWSIRGSKRWLTSVELRFPVLDRVGFDFPFGAIDLGVLRGALFADAGNAWDDTYTETLGSIGAGLRFNLFGIIVFRYDFGKRIERNFRAFQHGTFQQFFFGWDF